jgi:hypothetical protein
MDYDDCTPQEIANLMIRHAEALRELMHRWNSIQVVLASDPDTVIIHACDTEIEQALEAFEGCIDFTPRESEVEEA